MVEKILDGALPLSKYSTQEQVLSILYEEFPLSAKEIFYRLRSQSGRNITYQAVHKTLSKLAESKILNKKESKYSIDDQWITGVQDRFKRIEMKYNNKPIPKIVIDSLKEPVRYHFDDFTEAALFIGNLWAHWIETGQKNNPDYILLRHGWWPLKFDFSHFELLAKMDDKNPKSRIIFAKNTPFDRWISKLYTHVASGNLKIIVGIKENVEEDLMINGDVMIQVRYSKATRQFLDDLYQKIHGIGDLFKIYLHNKIENNNFSIDITISRNAQLSKIVVEKIKSHFD